MDTFSISTEFHLGEINSGSSRMTLDLSSFSSMDSCLLQLTGSLICQINRWDFCWLTRDLMFGWAIVGAISIQVGMSITPKGTLDIGNSRKSTFGLLNISVSLV